MAQLRRTKSGFQAKRGGRVYRGRGAKRKALRQVRAGRASKRS